MGLLTDLLFGLAIAGTAAAAGYAAYKIYKLLTAEDILREAKKLVPSAKKVEVTSIGPMIDGARRVSCGVYGSDRYEEMTLKAEEVSDLRVGQVIYA